LLAKKISSEAFEKKQKHKKNAMGTIDTNKIGFSQQAVWRNGGRKPATPVVQT